MVVRLVGRGHSGIRATHSKTLEFTADSEITARATCIVAVGAEAPDGRHLAGPLRITMTAGRESFTFEALANPSWPPGGAAVIRRSGLRLPGTLATEATAAASDLPRPLVASLQDPDTIVTALIEPIRGRPTAVLLALDPAGPPDPRLAAELAAADVIAAEDEVAARLVGERVTHGPVAVDGRVLVIACQDLPGATVVDALRHVEVDTVGLPAPLAAAAASPSRGPIVIAPEGADLRDIVRSTPAGSRLVVRVPADQVAGALSLAADVRGSPGAVALGEHGRPRRVEAGASLPGRDPVHLCFDAASESSALDPAVRAAVTGLLADGASTKTTANALATLTGWERRRAYDAVLNWPIT